LQLQFREVARALNFPVDAFRVMNPIAVSK